MALSKEKYLENRKHYFAVVAWDMFLGFRALEYLKIFKKVRNSKVLENEIVFDDKTRLDFNWTYNFIEYAANMLNANSVDTSQSIFVFLKAWAVDGNLVNELCESIRNQTLLETVKLNTSKYTVVEWYNKLTELETEMIANANINDIYHD